MKRNYDLHKAYDYKYIEIYHKSIEKEKDGGIEGYLERYDNDSVYKPSYKEFIKILNNIKGRYVDNPEYLSIINLLIGNKRLYDRTYFITDCSYRKNSVRFKLTYIDMHGFDNGKFHYITAGSIRKKDIKDIFKKYKTLFIFIDYYEDDYFDDDFYYDE